MKEKSLKCMVLVDGEHYPPVILQALDIIKKDYGYNIVGGVFLGGMEKIGKKRDLENFDISLILEDDIFKGVKEGLDRFKPDIVIDLSDEPVIGYIERFKIANLILNKGIIYKGADFILEPPVYEAILKKPSIMVAGTGKRVGKTAIGGYVARFLKGDEGKINYSFNPCVVTMGRGGPSYPEIIQGHKIDMNPEYFLDEVKKGKHAASDHYEDALMGRVRTIGCRRCGGGLSGKPFYSVVKQGVKIANDIENDILILEGSGATNPPVKTDTCIMTVGAHQPIEYISGYMGPLRIMMSDLVILTMCEEPMADYNKVKAMVDVIKSIKPDIPVIETIFRPKPLKNINNKKVIFCTTAPEKIGEKLKKYLENNYNCKVLGITHNLSNRLELKKDLDYMFSNNKADVLLTEVKAASMDVATFLGIKNNLEVCYVDNVPVLKEEKLKLKDYMLNIVELTLERFNNIKKCSDEQEKRN